MLWIVFLLSSLICSITFARYMIAMCKISKYIKTHNMCKRKCSLWVLWDSNIDMIEWMICAGANNTNYFVSFRRDHVKIHNNTTCYWSRFFRRFVFVSVGVKSCSLYSFHSSHKNIPIEWQCLFQLRLGIRLLSAPLKMYIQYGSFWSMNM